MKKGRPFGRRDFKTEEERQAAFWERVSIGGADECWNWNGYVEKQTGYGKVLFDKRLNGAHRYAYMITRGPIPPGMLVCHRCDNRRCQNPAHLFLGTYTDNNRDMFAKGRGSNPPHNPRFTAEQVLRIRAKWIPYRVTMSMIAIEEGVSRKAIELAIHKYKSVVSI